VLGTHQDIKKDYLSCRPSSLGLTKGLEGNDGIVLVCGSSEKIWSRREKNKSKGIKEISSMVKPSTATENAQSSCCDKDDEARDKKR
jgi:hypothetical protein